MTKLNEGDVVRLKSGGPAMTLDFIVEPSETHAMCSWFEGSKVQRRTFALASLQAHTTPKQD